MVGKSVSLVFRYEINKHNFLAEVRRWTRGLLFVSWNYRVFFTMIKPTEEVLSASFNIKCSNKRARTPHYRGDCSGFAWVVELWRRRWKLLRARAFSPRSLWFHCWKLFLDYRTWGRRVCACACSLAVLQLVEHSSIGVDFTKEFAAAATSLLSHMSRVKFSYSKFSVSRANWPPPLLFV